MGGDGVIGVYIMSNRRNTVVYVGCTHDLIRRVYEHRLKAVDGFTKKYNLTKLVYYKPFGCHDYAREWEIELKKWRRAKKDKLIEEENPTWRDLWDEIVE